MPWRDVRVGHVLRVDDEELFPADLLCLYSALPDNACFIKTTNLDGESNLKIRRPVDLREAAPEEESDVMRIKVLGGDPGGTLSPVLLPCLLSAGEDTHHLVGRLWG